MELESLKFVIWYLVVDDLLPFINFYVKTYLFFNDSLTYVMNYNYLFTESRILRFTIQIYDSIYETLSTIQGKIPILTTLLIDVIEMPRDLYFELFDLKLLFCASLVITSVIKISIWILKSYDFIIQHYENNSNLN